MKTGIGFTQVSCGGETHYELCTASEGRVKQGAEYRGYDSREEAEAAARKVAAERGKKYIGEVR